MRTREVPKSSWAKTLETIANCEAYRPVVIRVEGTPIGDQPLAQDIPLLGLSLERKGAAPDTIEISVSHPGGKQHLTHQIPHPAHLYIQETDHGQVACVNIEDEAHVKTLIFFRH